MLMTLPAVRCWVARHLQDYRECSQVWLQVGRIPGEWTAAALAVCAWVCTSSPLLTVTQPAYLPRPLIRPTQDLLKDKTAAPGDACSRYSVNHS